MLIKRPGRPSEPHKLRQGFRIFELPSSSHRIGRTYPETTEQSLGMLRQNWPQHGRFIPEIATKIQPLYIDFFLDKQLYVVIFKNHPSLSKDGFVHRPNATKVVKSWRRPYSKAHAETGHGNISDTAF
jgi:hypothetical protein